MTPTRKLSRRSFLASVAGTVAAAGAIAVLATDEAQAQSGCTDSDNGPNSDSPGNGRSCGGGRRSGCTDSDSGSYADRAGNGRCRQRVVRRSGCTDSDTGRYADPAGNGRCRRRARRSCTDSDGGRYADRAGHGRRC
jgi:hypothetical protein